MRWSDEQDAQLRKLWDDGLSANQIAGEMGEPGWYPTRNSIIGRMHRLGLSGRATVKSKPQPPRPRPVWTAPIRPAPPPAEAIEATDVDPGFDRDVPVGERKTLLALEPGDCKWPIGDPRDKDFAFCGRDAIEGMPYCHFHRSVAYQPAGRPRTVFVPQRRH